LRKKAGKSARTGSAFSCLFFVSFLLKRVASSEAGGFFICSDTALKKEKRQKSAGQ